MMVRRLREGVEFFQFLRSGRRRARSRWPPLKRLVVTADDFGLEPRGQRRHRSRPIATAS